MISGKTVSQIARDEGLSRASVSAQANGADVRQIMATLVNSEQVKVHKLFLGALAVIEEAFEALSVAQFQGKRVELGPDHYARLAAAKRLLEFANAGRAAPKEPEAKSERVLTVEELQRVIQAENEGAVQ